MAANTRKQKLQNYNVDTNHLNLGKQLRKVTWKVHIYIISNITVFA